MFFFKDILDLIYIIGITANKINANKISALNISLFSIYWLLEQEIGDYRGTIISMLLNNELFLFINKRILKAFL